MIKQLIINEVVFAKYSIEGSVLFIKVLKEAFKNNHTVCPYDKVDEHFNQVEDFCIQIISVIEDRTFEVAGYLNV